MPEVNPRDPVFDPRWTVVSGTKLDPAVIDTLEPRVVREPRVLVPIDVEALVVPTDGLGDRGDVRARALDATPDGRRMPAPFSDAAPLEPGVHVHWALPDGLTHADPEAPGLPEDDPGFQPLPDRWLVVRLEPVRRSLRQRPTMSWIVEAERGRSVPLSEWNPNEPFSPGPDDPRVVDAADLTAATGADPAWAAVYDNVRNRFGFHDDLTGVGRGGVRLTYVVIGWYGRRELDPLHPGSGVSLHDLGWDLDTSTYWSALDRSAEEIGQAQKFLHMAGMNPSKVGVLADVQATLPLGIGSLTPRNTVVAEMLQLPPRPRQSIFHGAVTSVPARNRRLPDLRPGARAVRIGIGPSVSDAGARLLAGDDAEQERLLAAFTHGVVEEYARSDGFSTVDAAIHQKGFGTYPGDDHVTERIRESRPVTREGVSTPPSGSSGAVVRAPDDIQVLASSRVTDVTLKFAKSRSGLFDLAVKERETSGITARPAEATVFTDVRRPGPRYWYPNDPVLALLGLRRSLRHGYDGRFDPDEMLTCRLSGQPVRGYGDLVTGERAVAPIRHGAVPPECDQLVREAALLDPGGVDDLVRAVPTGIGVDAGRARLRLEAEMSLGLHLRGGRAGAAGLLPWSMRDGVEPSPVGMTHWRAQPWVPLYVEWEVRVHDTDRLHGWALGDVDLERGSPIDDSGERARVESGRSLLASAAAKTLADSIDRFLVQEDRLDDAGSGLLDEATEAALAGLAATARLSDVLTGGIAGLNDRYLGLDPDQLAGPEEAVRPVALPQLLRAGLLTVTRLRVVDAFGRVLDLSSRVPRLEVADPYLPPDRPTGAQPAVLLTPRVTTPTRVLLRLLDAGDDAAEARVDEETPLLDGSPVAGFLVPDHADDAVELFDGTGSPLGQLFHRGLRSEVTWEGVPGRPGPVGAGPQAPVDRPGARHLARLAVALVERDALERAAADRALGLDEATAEDVAAGLGESPLRALLRAVDTTLWTTDPFGSTGLEHVSVLTGRPIAVVRARLRIDLYDDSDDYGLPAEDAAARRAAFGAMADRSFPIRLGSLARFDDGLLGYYVDDDYSVFHPVHATVKSAARPLGAQEGFLGGVNAAAEFGSTLDDETRAEPIEHPFVADAAPLLVRPGQTIHLTLLMLPGSGVHVTSGVVPRKRIELARSWIAEPLARLLPSFRVGPVLVDPESIRMPRISALPEGQEFTRRDTTTSWRDDPILAASQTARISDTPATAQEGWVRGRVETNGEG